MINENDNKKIIILPTGILDAKKRERLSKEGYITIECDEPEKIKILMPGVQIPQIETNDFMDAAIEAMANYTYDSICASFMRKWDEKIKAAKSKAAQSIINNPKPQP
jgi:hypothetical protein